MLADAQCCITKDVEAVYSLCFQTTPPAKIILVDDGSIRLLPLSASYQMTLWSVCPMAMAARLRQFVLPPQKNTIFNASFHAI